MTKYISGFLEVSRHNRIHQVHKRFFYPIHMWLDRREIVNWANLVQEDLTKALASTSTTINYGPQLTRILRWAIANPGFHLGTSERIEPAPRPRPPTTPRNVRNPTPRNPRRARRARNLNPHLDQQVEPEPMPSPEPEPQPMDLDINISDILRQIPNIGSEGSHHTGGENQHQLSDRRSGMDQNNPITTGATNPVNIEEVRVEGREEHTLERETSPDQGSTDSNLGDQLKEIAATLEVLHRKVRRKEEQIRRYDP